MEMPVYRSADMMYLVPNLLEAGPRCCSLTFVVTINSSLTLEPRF